MVEIKDKVAALEVRARGNPAAMLSLAYLLHEGGHRERALALCRSALRLAPHDAKLAAKARQLISFGVPDWHFDIIKDEARNAAYDAALRRAVKPGSRVLEVGTGTGLIAMMAARAGAADVIACEMTSIIAEKAAEIVAANGYADRVRVIPKHSNELNSEADMGGRADILVSEIISNNLLGQNVLAAHEHAVRNLLKPGARVIPARGAVRVALAYDANDDLIGLEKVGGFDLSAFASLAQSVRAFRVGHERLSLRSETADLFVFDFASAHYCAPSRSSLPCRSTGGPVNGIAQWIALELDEITRYENRPASSAKSCWGVLFYPFTQTIDTFAGQEFDVFGSHDRQNLTIWAEAK